MVGLPIMDDQPKIGQNLELAGIGKIIQWKELSDELLSDAITNVISDPE